MGLCPKKWGIMEYSKDIILGNKLFRKGQAIKKEGQDNKTYKEHKFIVSMGITCAILIMLDCFLVYSFIELFQKI